MRLIVAIAVPILIVVLGVGGFVYLIKTKEELVAQTPPEKVWIVSATAVEIADVSPTLKAFGQVVAGRSVELRPLVAGQIAGVGPNYVEGGVVRVGELIAEIDRFDFQAAVSEAEAQLLEAEAKAQELEGDLAAERQLLQAAQRMLTLRQRDVTRREELLGRGAASAKTLDDARMSVTEAERERILRVQTIERMTARIAQQKATIERLRVVRERALRDLANTRLIAPFDGFLTAANAAIGQQVGVGDRLGRLVDAGRLEVRFHVTDRDFARLLGPDPAEQAVQTDAAAGLIGRPVAVVWDIGDRSFRFDGRLSRIAGEIAAETGGVDLFVDLPGVGIDTPLRPGAFVTIETAEDPYAGVARLPETALDAERQVYVIDDGRLRPEVVEVVRRLGDDVLVRGRIAPGEQVVSKLFDEIGPGAKVDIQ